MMPMSAPAGRGYRLRRFDPVPDLVPATPSLVFPPLSAVFNITSDSQLGLGGGRNSEAQLSHQDQEEGGPAHDSNTRDGIGKERGLSD